MVREPSITRLNSLNEACNSAISDEYVKKHLGHMMDENGRIDLSMAKNPMEFAFAERITKDPRKQGRDEINQSIKLNESYNFFEKLRRHSLFLVNGKVYDNIKETGINKPVDIDFKIEECGWTILGEMKAQYGNGGSQEDRFDKVTQLIGNAPLVSSKNKICLCIFVSGDFWNSKRSSYFNYERHFTGNFNLIDCIRKEAEGKIAVIITDEDLPKKKTSFYNKHIRNKYEQEKRTGTILHKKRGIYTPGF